MIKRIYKALLATALVALCAGVSQAQAQHSMMQFDLPAQPLADALRAVSKQTDTNILMDLSLIGDRQAPAIRAALTIQEALNRLLQGTGLTSRFVDEKTVVVATGERNDKPAAAMPATGVIRLAQAPPVATAPGQEVLEEVSVWAKYVPEANNSAAKMDISLLETPQSISVITGDQIELLNWQTIEQAIRYTAGIVGGTYGDDGRFDWLFMRGFKPTTYLDGLQLPEGTFAVSRVDLSALESIEILKGPSSGLYGAVPPGGLVNMISRRPQRQFEAKIDLQAGNFEHYQGDAEITGPINSSGTLMYRLGGVYQDAGSPVEMTVPNKRLMVQPSLTWQPNDRFTLTLLSHFQDDDMGTDLQFLPEAGTALPNPNGQLSRDTYVSDPNYDSFLRDEYHVGYVLDYQINDRIKFHQAVRKSDVDVDGKQLYGGGYFDDAEMTMLGRYAFRVLENQNNLATDSAFQFDFDTGGMRHKLLTGVDYRDSGGSYTGGFDVGPSLDLYNPVYGVTIGDLPLFTDASQDEKQIGFYVQDHARIANWVFTGTLRHDDYESDGLERLDGSTSHFEQKATSGRFGVNYVFDSGVSPYVSYSESFQPQSGFDPTGKPFVPTTGQQYEAGIKYQPQGRQGLISLIAYDLKQQNVPTSAPGIPNSREQVGEIHVKGIELEGVARLNESFSINGAYSYTDAIVSETKRPVELGTQLGFTPRHQASLLLDYTVRLPSGTALGFGGGVRYLGETYGNPGEVGLVPANTQVDALLRYTTGPWRFTLNVNNLFDLKYLGSCDGFGSCYYGYSRTVMGTLTREWGAARR